jgi:hypothetical protein
MQPQLDRSPRQMQISNQRFGANGAQLSARNVTSQDGNQLILRKQVLELMTPAFIQLGSWFV